MRRTDTITGHADRMRIGPWRGDPALALLSPTPGSPPSPDALNLALASVADAGYRTVLTPALTFTEQPVFLDRGFSVHERLHLLRHDLFALPGASAPSTHLRRGRARDVTAVLDATPHQNHDFGLPVSVTVLSAITSPASPAVLATCSDSPFTRSSTAMESELH